LLRVVFSVEQSLAKSPNTAEIQVYNLSGSTRTLVSEDDLEIELEAGYSGLSSVIFRGKVDAGKSQRDGINWVTTFQSTDGGKELRQSRINFNSRNTTVADAFDRVASAIGVGLGNAKEKIAEGNIRGALTEFSNGIVLFGPAKKELDRLASTFGYDWSIQNGQLQLLGPSDAIEPGDAIVLGPDTGMIGSPESGEKGIVEVRSLLIPQLTPGRVVQLKAAEIKGFYRVDRVAYQGDTRGQDWYADLELKPR
jgi:hypothetical protein